VCAIRSCTMRILGLPQDTLLGAPLHCSVALALWTLHSGGRHIITSFTFSWPLQDVFATTGAHTGEVSASMLKDVGIKYALVGHSERRQKGETNDVVATKAKAALENGLTVIACLGETLAERDAGKTADVVTGQLAVRTSSMISVRSQVHV
jgi:triosephosphate isomerase